MFITVQSHTRHENVKWMHKNLNDIESLWFVPESQIYLYERQGAVCVPVKETQFPMKSLQLNAALDMGFKNNEIVITMDDDFVETHCLHNNEVVSLSDLIKICYNQSLYSKYPLIGFPTLPNTGQHYGFLTGQLMFHKKTNLRFDENMTWMEDLDYCINHHISYGGITPILNYGINFHVQTQNDSMPYIGGFKDKRTEESHTFLIDYIVNKYNNSHLAIDKNAKIFTDLTKMINWKLLGKNDR